MIREKYSIKQNETSLNIVQGKVEAVRSKNIQKTAVRLYDKGKISVSGGFGNVDEEMLTRQAEEDFGMNIAYSPEPEKEHIEKREASADIEDPQELLQESETLLAELRRQQPDFSFSNKISMNKIDHSLQNDSGLDLRDKQTILAFDLLIKEKKSANIMDAFSSYSGMKYDRQEFLRLTNMICDAYKITMELKSGEYPVVFLEADITYKTKMLRDLHGLLLASGGSYFSDKIGQKIFNENFTVYQTRNPEDGVYKPFFDLEGVSNPDERFSLIENGVIKNGYMSKLYAEQFKMAKTGSAGGEFDAVPNIGIPTLSIKPSGKTVKEILNGMPGLLVILAFGGDFTPEGSFGTPVQLAYQFDGENFIGRVPEFKLSGHINKMFGEGFMGVSIDSITSLEPVRTIVMKMQVDL